MAGAEKLLLTPDGAPRDRIVSLESEYGFAYTRTNGKIDQPGTYRLLEALPRGSMEYLETGERLYEDHEHPELAGAEELIFLNAAYRFLSGHGKLQRFFTERQNALLSDDEIAPGTVHLEANTCSPHGRSWGRHENLLASRELRFADFIPALATHRLSRIIWSGAGAVAKSRDGQYRFQLSEKADFIERLYGEATIERRALVNTRDEPLADSELYRRIHNITGEAVFSPFANALVLASDSIVLRACELGVNFDDLLPLKPAKAMRQISHDPSLRQTVLLADGRRLNAIQLQREIMERSVTAARAASYLTEQEEFWAGQWATILDKLEIDPRACGKYVDWVVKQKLIERELDGRRQLADDKVRPLAESDVAIAWHKAIDYHGLLPREGAGMTLLRRGAFAFSPTAEQLAGDMPLPETRAKLRGESLRSLRSSGYQVTCDWQHLRRTGSYLVPPQTLILNDPYATTDSRLGALYANDDLADIQL